MTTMIGTQDKTGAQRRMGTNWPLIKNFLGGVIGSMGMLLGRLPDAVKLLLIIMLVDAALGIILAMSRGAYCRQKSLRSAMKKAAVLILVAMSYAIDQYTKMTISIASPVSLFFSWHFATSGLDNAARLGLPIPAALRRALAAMEASDASGNESKDTAATTGRGRKPNS